MNNKVIAMFQSGLWFMVFKANFNNISVTSWRSVLLVEETGENHRPDASHWQTFRSGAVLVVIVWYLDLQLPIQSVPITTKIVSANPAHGVVYSIQHYVISFVSDLRQVSGFHRVLRFLSTNITDRHVESGVTHHSLIARKYLFYDGDFSRKHLYND
jgi:hypothetical protein